MGEPLVIVIPKEFRDNIERMERERMMGEKRNYDEMPAGLEMDELIHVNVLGWKRVEYHGDSYIVPPDIARSIPLVKSEMDLGAITLNPYSRNLSDIGHLLNTLDKHFIVQVSSEHPKGPHKWKCILDHIWNRGDPDAWAEADTLPLAVCRAALKAVEKYPHFNETAP